MKAAANIVAILAWGSVLAAVWCGYALPVAVRPSFGMMAALVLASLIVALVAPAFLLGLEKQTPAPAAGQRRLARPARPSSRNEENE